ncbi:HD-GYP domain-containing protein [Thermotoga profunda]|uniref:HD-GYP domain-containing protein n=1 Tax=Thermotoga profunda TaxID=1508420 RepID=UPI000A541EF6|nr:HD-GYP domain-containing protein [Thermotoga profunda]
MTVAFVLSALFFININHQKASQVEQLALQVFVAHLQYTAKGLSEGYFHWDDMFKAILRGDEGFLSRQVEEMKSLYPNLIKVDLIDENIEKEYEIGYENGFVRMKFGIYDDEGQLRVKDKSIYALFDSGGILTETGLKNVVRISYKNGDFKLVYSGRIFSFYSFIISLLIAFMTVISFESLRRFLIRQHYEYEGLEAIIEILSKKDSYTANHSKMVARISLELGKISRLSKRDLKLLYKAAILHDIGKIAVPESILNKLGKLSTQEYEIIQIHPEIGAQIVEKFPGLRETAKIIRYHHERLDGSGYPERLQGEQIPLLARILAVADVYSALIDDRPYRKAYTELEAIQIMKDMPLDQKFVDLLEECVRLKQHNIATEFSLKD